MAWTTPGTATAGEVLTAAFWNANVRDNSIMGNPVYDNEAARDAAITAPSEGQRAYLTAPTIPAATGEFTAIPTGIVTIYNGSVWVCCTPVFARTTNRGTTTSGSYTATLSGTPGTNPSVTLVTGTTAIVTVTARMSNSLVGNGVGVAVAVSGAGSVAAGSGSEAYYVTPIAGEAYFHQMTSTVVLTGLTAGTNTFAANYRATGGTGYYEERRVIVTGLA